MITIMYSLASELTNKGIHVNTQLTTGPGNLLKAADSLPALRKSLSDAYGNLGFVRAWIEVDGVEVDQYALDDLNRAAIEQQRAEWRKDPCDRNYPTGRMERARQILADIANIKNAA